MAETFELVPFHEHQILTVKTDEDVVVVMKPIVQALGLAWHAQFERIKRHPVIGQGVRVTRIPSAGGMQDALALDLERFHGWLLTLVPDRIKDEAKRDLIVRYQREAFRVVFEYFHGKIGGERRQERSTAALISGQNQILRLMQKLKNSRNPAERRALWTMLDKACTDQDIPTPGLQDLGRDQATAPDLLKHFWAYYFQLEAEGNEISWHRRPDLIALNLPEVRAWFTAKGWKFSFDDGFYDALKQSDAPKYLRQGNVNCTDGEVRHCWVFERK